MSDILLTTTITITILIVAVAIGVALRGPLARTIRDPAEPLTEPEPPGVGIGTVRTVADPIVVDVESISGQRFVGTLRAHPGESALDAIRPGAVLLVTFDLAARERLSLADDIIAVSTAFDRMLVGKGLVTGAQLALIRQGTRSRAVVTAMTATGAAREDYREVELDLMVTRPSGGQFPAHEIALIPDSALDGIGAGSVIDAFYDAKDESSVAVCVPPG